MFAEAARSLVGPGSVEQILQRVVELATGTVDGAAMAGVTAVRRDGTVETPAYTDDLVLEVDRAQGDFAEGPCLEASIEDKVLWIEDMAQEQRWPRFAKRAQELGIRSMVACSLVADHGGRSALNLHASEPAAFDETAVEIASILAAHSSVALNQAGLAESMRSAMASRQAIGEATGILMERYRTDSRQAFEMLAKASQNLNVKLRLVAEHVVLTGQNPLEITERDLPRRA